MSVVVPVYSGAKYLLTLFESLRQLRSRWLDEGSPLKLTEIIFVDDAAIDTSPDIIDNLSREHSWVASIHLSRNFGQHPATVAGILHTSGDWVVTIDEDLQHPPNRINDLFRKVAHGGCDIVYANAEESVHENHVRDLGSVLYKRLIEKFSGNPNVRHFNSFRLIRGSVARAASSVCGHDTYFDVALSWFTQRVGVVRMQLKDERFIREGKSGYRLSKLLSHARRMLMSSGAKITRIGGLAGLSVVILSSMAALILFVSRVFLYSEPLVTAGWTSIMLTMLFLGGTVTFLIGIVLEYLSLLVLNAHGKPIFFVVDRSTDIALAEYFRLDKQ
ncbi:glycosyltransferase [Microvirga sp. Mcv34]|uniref:glycosyltransferase n=1 Tax=Microvirga sp. Mcv34 TaxID=2926016 RepID=UPI0021C6787B|nr:glycosyltransferase [Microvirga sp. Mcv34]